MAPKEQATIGDEKATNHEAEKTDYNNEKGSVMENADFTGAVAKTDPEEIRLVKKLDWRIMVCNSPLNVTLIVNVEFSPHYA